MEDTDLSQSIAEVVERLGYECVHVGLGTGSAHPRVQVLIDSIGGITVDDCEKVSRSVNRLLDEQDEAAPQGRYYLEVSSPGLERPLFTLADYARFSGREARVRLKSPEAGRKTLTGFIRDVSDGCVTLQLRNEAEEEEARVPFNAIRSGNLVFRDFEPRGKKGMGNRKHHEEELF